MNDELWGMINNILPPPEESLLVITGTQRSGTSFMAEFFRRCGYDLGTQFWDDRVNGGLENPDACNYFRMALVDLDFPFRGYWDMIERESFIGFPYLQQHYNVIKFSYLMSNPIFLTHWLRARENCNDRFLIMERNLEDVIASRKTKPEFDAEDSDLLPREIGVLRRNWKICHHILMREGAKHFFVPFPSARASEIVGMINRNSGIQLPADAEEIYTDLFDPNKVQFK